MSYWQLVNRVSKENVVSDAETDAGSDNERDDGETTVDLEIGISVDHDVSAAGTGDSAANDAVELAFDEREVIEAADGEFVFEAVGADERNGAAEPPAFAGPRLEDDERETLEAADVDPDAVADKEYSYRMLLDADVDESTGDVLRRRFSLPWSFESDGDLERRSAEVRGLGAAEREWIAVSRDDGWQSFEYEHAITTVAERARPAERPWPRSTPVIAVTGVGPNDADALAEAGVRSAERLAMIRALSVANVLDLNVLHVRTWRHNARELLE